MMLWMRLVFESWSAWEATGLQGCPVGALALQLGTTREVVLNLLKAGRLDEIRIYEAGQHVATLVKTLGKPLLRPKAES
jgi:hypothetical protein